MQFGGRSAPIRLMFFCMIINVQDCIINFGDSFTLRKCDGSIDGLANFTTHNLKNASVESAYPEALLEELLEGLNLGFGTRINLVVHLGNHDKIKRIFNIPIVQGRLINRFDQAVLRHDS